MHIERTQQHDANWQPTRDAIDDDGTITEAFSDYIKQHRWLAHLYSRESTPT